jgi:hypothetical protein
MHHKGVVSSHGPHMGRDTQPALRSNLPTLLALIDLEGK